MISLRNSGRDVNRRCRSARRTRDETRELAPGGRGAPRGEPRRRGRRGAREPDGRCAHHRCARRGESHPEGSRPGGTQDDHRGRVQHLAGPGRLPVGPSRARAGRGRHPRHRARPGGDAGRPGAQAAVACRPCPHDRGRLPRVVRRAVHVPHDRPRRTRSARRCRRRRAARQRALRRGDRRAAGGDHPLRGAPASSRPLDRGPGLGDRGAGGRVPAAHAHRFGHTAATRRGRRHGSRGRRRRDRRGVHGTGRSRRVRRD